MRPAPTRRRAPRSSSSTALTICALVVAAVLGGGLYVWKSKSQQRKDQRVGDLTGELFSEWRAGRRSGGDKTGELIYNVSAWTINDVTYSQTGTRCMVAATVDSATKDGTPARVNWTVGWLKTSDGWQARKVWLTDEAPKVDAWNP